MFEKLSKLLSQVDADYADLRYEIKTDTSIVFNGKELVNIGSNVTDGYVLRVLKNGGLASVAFTRAADGPSAVATAQENAEIIGRHVRQPVAFAEVETVQDTCSPKLNEDPRQISMEEKLELTRHYNGIALQNEMVVSTNILYGEVIREKFFLSTEGSQIREDLVTTFIGGGITSKDGNTVQNVRVAIGGSNGFGILRNGEEEFERKAGIAAQLLKARPVSGGVHKVVLNPQLAGVFTHEAFGHFSEADLIEDSPSMREKMKLGAMLGAEFLNIQDNPTLPDQLGCYQYDDEGVRARPTQLLKCGVLSGRLHSRRTAAGFGEPVTGHCVAEDFRYAPIVRMGTIFIEPGHDSFEALLARLDDGYYFLDHKGGQTAGENFTFGAQCGYRVRNGKLAEMVRDINISGNLYETLRNISAIGNDLELSKTGGCGKGQINIRSCFGAPHILVKNVVVGGA